MQNVKLAETMQRYHLDKKTTAKGLFPDNKFPVEALDRVLKGKGLLNSEQISRLALMSGASIASLFSGDDWLMSFTKPRYSFLSGVFTAYFFPETRTVKIFDKTSLFHEEVLAPQGDVLVVPLLEHLTKKRDEYIQSNTKS